MIIGVTGGPATGKSTICSKFEELGAVVIDIDAIAKRVVRKGHFPYNQLVKHFGPQILFNPGGEINRKKLAALVANDIVQREVLHNSTRTSIYWELSWQLTMAIVNLKPLIIIKAPQLFESPGLLFWFNAILTVYCDEKTQVERLKEYYGISEAEARVRVGDQMSLEKKCEMSDYVIDSSCSKDILDERVKEMYAKLNPSWTIYGILIPTSVILVCALMMYKMVLYVMGKGIFVWET